MDTSNIHTLPAPPSPAERLRKALNILDSLNAEYDIKYRGIRYSRTTKNGQELKELWKNVQRQ